MDEALSLRLDSLAKSIEELKKSTGEKLDKLDVSINGCEEAKVEGIKDRVRLLEWERDERRRQERKRAKWWYIAGSMLAVLVTDLLKRYIFGHSAK